MTSIGNIVHPMPGCVHAGPSGVDADAAKAGAPTRFTLLFEQHVGALRRYASRIVRSPDAAEDVVQDVFLGLWRRWDRLEAGTGIRSYLYMATRDRALTHLARARREEECLRSAAAPGIVVEGPALPRDDDGDAIGRAIAQVLETLPPRQRAAMTLRLRHQLPSVEIARRLGISPRTVEVHLSRATRTVRRRLPTLLHHRERR
jgi:RNA polymerase sigma-70 factor (ECF subfamily)